MSTTHSLSSSVSPGSTKRSSQLPLPSSSAPRTYVPPTSLSKPSTLNIPPNTSLNSPRSPTGSASSPSFHLQSVADRDGAPFSPTSPPFNPHFSSTHAGGIQPSASFFHPSRPIEQRYSRPGSPNSATSSGLPTHAPDGELFQLAPLTKQVSNSSDEPFGQESTMEDHQRQANKRHKSREPLLPFVSKPGMTSNPSSMHQGSIGTGNGSPSFTARGGSRVRSSFERLFRRGLSFESSRKSTSTGSALRTPLDDHRAYEGKLNDDGSEYNNNARRYEQSLPVSPSRRAALRHAVPPSVDPSFIPSPPPHDPPLCAVPVKDASGKWVRNYERHPSRNKFFFSGRMLTGGDSPWAFIASSTLVFAITGVWFGTTCVWWWKNESPAVALVGSYLCLITVSNMIITATRDPGILPRNLDPDPPYPSTSPSDGGVRAPMPRDLKVRADVVRVKYCPTCKTYRPPRSSHCKMCDNCVDGCDHHCQWVNNCVGRRNYTPFFAFLTSATITLIMVICTSALHLYLLTRKDHINLVHAFKKAPGSVVAFCLSISVVWPVAALLSYHMHLLLLNVTTIEQIRNQAHKSLVPGPAPPNPFSHGNWRRNLVAVLCRPLGYSYLDGHGVVTEDDREVNPGMVSDGGDGTKGNDEVR